MFSLDQFEPLFEKEIETIATKADPAHDLIHFKRVVELARRLAHAEKAQMEVVIPAAWFHDYVIVPKNDLGRITASQASAMKAIDFLKAIQYPGTYLKDISHAIECHSFSAKIEPRTIEACVVQDADRLDALGAIGVARCFAVGTQLQRPFYNVNDPFCERREADDKQYTLDHFYKKLFLIATTMKTKSGQEEAQKRLRFMEEFIRQLKAEIK
jgi:uncharacterized protein